MSGWYGSVQNRIAERAKMPEPVVGMGVTECCYTDCHAYEIVEVKDSKHITVRPMKTSLKPGSDWLDQDYEYSSDETARCINLYKTKNGWRERIGSHGLGCNGFALGYAREYRDPSF